LRESFKKIIFVHKRPHHQIKNIRMFQEDTNLAWDQIWRDLCLGLNRNQYVFIHSWTSERDKCKFGNQKPLSTMFIAMKRLHKVLKHCITQYRVLYKVEFVKWDRNARIYDNTIPNKQWTKFVKNQWCLLSFGALSPNLFLDYS
jgi:hypothetical protein